LPPETFQMGTCVEDISAVEYSQNLILDGFKCM